jgi:hypothetical protein
MPAAPAEVASGAGTDGRARSSAGKFCRGSASAQEPHYERTSSLVGYESGEPIDEDEEGD